MKKKILLQGCFILIFLCLMACHSGPRVEITLQTGKSVSFQVELADNPAAQEQGLQHRETLLENHGMLFIFPEERALTFWMKNTPLPLDLIFINSDFKIVGIIANTTPFSLAPLAISTPSRYVLEINAGRAQSTGIHTGDPVKLRIHSTY
jgi:uncharacterized membrane protein (UPF0127 family)